MVGSLREHSTCLSHQCYPGHVHPDLGKQKNIYSGIQGKLQCLLTKQFQNKLLNFYQNAGKLTESHDLPINHFHSRFYLTKVLPLSTYSIHDNMHITSVMYMYTLNNLD